MEHRSIMSKSSQNPQLQFSNNTNLLTFPIEIMVGKASDNLDNNSYPIYFRHEKIGDLRHKDIINLRIEKELIDALNTQKKPPSTAKSIVSESKPLKPCSEHLIKLNHFIDKAANVNCPVVIEGDYGCDKLSVAHTIHCKSELKTQPFIEITCETNHLEGFQRQIIRGCKRAQNGSIFINGVDQLTLEQQNFLTELLSLGVRIKGGTKQYISMNNVRVLVATSYPLADLVKQHNFSRQLYSNFNYLHVWLPPLQERKEDIPSLVEIFLNKYSKGPQKFISDKALKILKQYEWVENDEQLEKVVARLICLSAKPEISFCDIQEHAPEILLNQKYNNNQTGLSARSKSLKDDPDKIVKILLYKKYEQLEGLHTGFQKALIYLAEHYCDELTLKVLSEKGFVSPSHLSFLFKSSLNLCFKPLLAKLRIEKARTILESHPQSRITDISLEVGFGDLSHFEKLFKRLTNMTPREYKNICKSKC